MTYVGRELKATAQSAVDVTGAAVWEAVWDVMHEKVQPVRREILDELEEIHDET